MGCLEQQQDKVAKGHHKPEMVEINDSAAAEIVPSDLVNSSKAVGHRAFNAAKKVLPRIYVGLEEEFYCGCRYSGKTVDLKSCGYVPRKNANRASRIEWEHVVPAEHLGRQRQCWQDGGRKNCSGHDALFDTMEGI